MKIINAQLLDDPNSLKTIQIESGRIAAITPSTTNDLGDIDAEGYIVLPAFTNPHLHLCKVFTLNRMNESAMKAYHGTQMKEAAKAIDLAAWVKQQYAPSWIRENIQQALDWAVEYGNLHIRAFADVDTKAKLIGLECLLEARSNYANRLNLQVVAFPQDGIVREPGALDLMREAMLMGADVVGGIPWIESGPPSQQAHVDACYDLAEQFDRPVSMLVDDTGDPSLRTLSMMVQTSIQRGWQGRSLAHHARAMSCYTPSYLHMLMTIMRKAKVGIVSDPHTGPLHAPVKLLLEAGNLVCLGQDDISDAYYPYGRNNMLEVAYLASHMLMMTSAAQQRQLIDMVTTLGAEAMGLTHYGVVEGAHADLVILKYEDLTEALRFHGKPKHVIYRGVHQNCVSYA